MIDEVSTLVKQQRAEKGDMYPVDVGYTRDMRRNVSDFHWSIRLYFLYQAGISTLHCSRLPEGQRACSLTSSV